LNEAILEKIYWNESDVHIKERLFLIVRVFSDNEKIESVAKQMHRSRAWAYKWYKRYNDEGIDGLGDKPRMGRPSFVDKDMMVKIRKELSDSNTGWDTKQVMDLIQKKTGIKYHREHIRRLLHEWGFSPKVPQKRFVRRATKDEVKSFKKGYNRR
jgi:transposase